MLSPEHWGSDRSNARPGLRTLRLDGRVVVTEISDLSLEQQGLTIGDELLAIDGVPTATYAEKHIQPYVSSSTAQDREVRTYSYSLLAGRSDTSARLTLRKPNGRRYYMDVPRSGYSIRPRLPTESFVLRDDGIAVLTAKQFEDDGALKLFSENFERLMKARGLVIDLRGNSGGDSDNGLAILSYLSKNPVPVAIEQYRGESAYSLARGGAIEWRRTGSGYFRQDHATHFNGPVVMLIDARTFSAGEDTAAAFKLMKRGSIVGMPSGGSTGQPMFFALPGGGSARVCVKRASYPDDTDFVGVGVLPDVVVETHVDDVIEGNDPTLARGLRELSKHDNAPRKRRSQVTSTKRYGSSKRMR